MSPESPPWIIDSGASFHAIGHKQAVAEGVTEFRDAPTMNIETANGPTASSREARVYVNGLQVWVWARVLEKPPKLLSMGMLCELSGFNFVWKGFAKPPFIDLSSQPLQTWNGLRT